jgi:nucleoside-diphosphate-sugar epimerase
MAQKILITGGAGYLGSIMTGTLLDAGFKVTVIDNLLYGQKSLFQYCNNPDFDFVFGDARDEKLMTELISKSDILIPLACLVGAPASDRDPWMAEAVNYGAISMLNKIRSKNQLVIYPNTNSGYGASSGQVHCTEDSPLEPISLYGKSKCQAELELLDSENAITFRLATVFGFSPRMRLDLLVNHFTYAAITDRYLVLFEKHFKRNYVHIRDVADCFLYSIHNAPKMIGRPFNLGLDSANLSKEELANKIKTYVPGFYVHHSEIGSDPDKRNYIVSNQRLREAGFEARRSLDEGIQELLKGYRMMVRQPFANI